MKLLLAIHKDKAGTYGVTIPDVPGCYSWDDTIDDAIRNARDAVYSHFEAVAAESGGMGELTSSTIEALVAQEEVAGAIWALVEIDISRLDSQPTRINISVPRFVLKKIDTYADWRHESRSGFIAHAALALIADETAVA